MKFKMNKFRMNYTSQGTDYLSSVNKWNSIIYMILEPIIFLNLLCLFVFSLSWAFYLLRKILKDYKHQKIVHKSRRNIHQRIWENDMKNFHSNLTKNILCVVICLSECGISFFIMFNILLKLPTVIPKSKNGFLKVSTIHGVHSFDLLLNGLTSRITNLLATLCFATTLVTVRILTEFLVYQYSYYKPFYSFKLDIAVFLYTFIALFIMGITRSLLTLYYICIVIVIIREFIIFVIASKKLCLSLKQHLTDAIYHENQSKYVILYYRTTYQNYKVCWRLFAVAFFFLIIGLSLYCLHPVVMKLSESVWLHSVEYKQNHPQMVEYEILYDSIIGAIELVLLAVGSTFQVIPCIIVSCRVILKRICGIVRPDMMEYSFATAHKHLFEKNYSAYHNLH